MSERQSFCGRVRSCFSFLSVEPVVFLVCIGLGLQAIIGQVKVKKLLDCIGIIQQSVL